MEVAAAMARVVAAMARVVAAMERGGDGEGGGGDGEGGGGDGEVAAMARVVAAMARVVAAWRRWRIIEERHRAVGSRAFGTPWTVLIEWHRELHLKQVGSSTSSRTRLWLRRSTNSPLAAAVIPPLAAAACGC